VGPKWFQLVVALQLNMILKMPGGKLPGCPATRYWTCFENTFFQKETYLPYKNLGAAQGSSRRNEKGPFTG